MTLPKTINIGLDGRKFPDADRLGAIGLLERCAELGYDGVFFRTVLDIVPDLDPGKLAAIRERADELELYLEMGLGKINPFNTPEAPEVRILGDGDYLLGMRRMIEAVTAIGCTNLWADTANYQGHSFGLFAIDRYRTDVDWTDQLAITTKFICKLSPILRARGAALAVETHEEITTHELARMIEAVGPEVMGVTLDLANVLTRGEDPIEATRRVAPYVRQTHMRDWIVFETPTGLERQIRACGDGLIDWQKVMTLLRDAGAAPNFTIENANGRDRNDIPINDPVWRAGQPDQSQAELDELVRLSRAYAADVAAGRKPGPDDYYADPFGTGCQEAFIRTSAETLWAAAAAVNYRTIAYGPSP
jgi:sugar phosphate isomerase/epimerase